MRCAVTCCSIEAPGGRGSTGTASATSSPPGRILESVVDGTIDVGHLDACRHMLVVTYDPAMTETVPAPESTATAPISAFVASPALPDETLGRLRASFAAARSRPWSGRFSDALLAMRERHA